ncbi:unnamed protein product [Rotaria sp. Silwood1]|nr:unnamed protein product [Rotaria sp. Silwood1]
MDGIADQVKQAVVENLSTRGKNFIRQISVQAEKKIDRLEQEGQFVNEILRTPIFPRLRSVDKNTDINHHTNIIIEPVSQHTIIETGIKHVEMKSGSQRIRWNLLFNLLLWLVVPLPCWIPFVSNQVALYIIPSIQGVIVFMWTKNKFKDAGFERIIFTTHPYGLSNEIPGKCSNSNYGLRKAVSEMNVADDDMKNILVTTCDADSKFPRDYIAALTWKYLKENQPALTTIYQSPLFYNWKLDSLSFVTRVTGLLRSLLMLGALIPFNINTMSIFSYSLSLAKKGNFIHPGYQMDDIICLIRWMGVTQQRLRISMIPVPVVSGPTSGETMEIEIMEWARQARRWTIGAAEVFHYFIIKANRMPKMAAFSWGLVFIIYYGVLLCTAGLYGLTSMLSMILIVKHVPPMIVYLMYGFLGLQMLTFLVAFIIDALIVQLMHISQCIYIRNAFHFILTPFVLLGYSLVELYALHEVIVFGKKVCKHGASKKSALK